MVGYIAEVGFLESQSLSLADGCLEDGVGIPIHEFLHTLGVYHQQSRSDRDSYITINWANIDPDRTNNFVKQDSALIYNVPYDYRSVMHYGKSAFSSTGLPTIETIPDASNGNLIGQQDGFFFSDLMIIHKMYNCSGHCNSSVVCPSVSYKGKDCKCYCADPDDSTNPPVDCTPVITTTTPTTTTMPTTTTERPTTTTPEDSPDNTCRRPGRPCGCGLPNSLSTCSRIPNSFCNMETNACDCLPDFSPYRRWCV